MQHAAAASALGHLLEQRQARLEELRLQNAAREQLDLEEKKKLSQYVAGMATPFYCHSFYDTKYVEDLKGRLAERMGGLLKHFRYNYISASPRKKPAAAETKPRFETEEDLLQEMNLLYQAALQTRGKILPHFQKFIKVGLEYFPSRDACKAWVRERFVKTREELASSDLEEDARAYELKLQILVRLELEHWSPTPESCEQLAEEAVRLLRSLMFVKDPGVAVDFFEDVLRERYAHGLNPLLMDVSGSLGLDAFEDEEEEELRSEAASSPPLWSLSSVSSTQQLSSAAAPRPPPRGSYSHIPPPPGGVIPYKQKKLQILVPRDTILRCQPPPAAVTRQRTPVKKKPARPVVTTPRGRHVLKNRYVKGTPDRRQGPRTELRRSREDDGVKVVPRSPRRAPLKRPASVSLFKNTDCKMPRLDEVR